jgi:hypothetical protein
MLIILASTITRVIVLGQVAVKGNLSLFDNLVRQRVKSLFNTQFSKVVYVESLGGELFVEGGAEGKCELSVVVLWSLVGVLVTLVIKLDISARGEYIGENNSLNLRSWVSVCVKSVVTLRAHAAGAVNIGPLRIAYACTGLVCIPQQWELEVELIAGCQASGPLEVITKIVTKLREVLAGSVSRAVIWACGTTASLSGVAWEALAFTSCAVAETSACTLSKSVSLVLSRWSINPSDFVWALSL